MRMMRDVSLSFQLESFQILEDILNPETWIIESRSYLRTSSHFFFSFRNTPNSTNVGTMMAPSLLRPFLTISSIGCLTAIISFYLRPSPLVYSAKAGDTIVVTGSSTGIGKHAALSLAKEGYTVFAGVRNLTRDGDALLKAAGRFDINTANIRPILLDVTNSEHIEKAVEDVSNYVGEHGLKGLFNNAGMGYMDAESHSVEFFPMDSYRKLFDVNYFGNVEVTKAFLKLLRTGQGRIIFNTSIAGIVAAPFLSAYASSKHALEGFADSLRRELIPHGVKVSIVAPGYVATPIFSKGIESAAFSEVKSSNIYTKAEVQAAQKFFKDMVGAPSPKVTSEAILHALQSEHPQIRYVVGKDYMILKILRYVPISWVDFLLTIERPEITEAEKLEIRQRTKQMEIEDYAL